MTSGKFDEEFRRMSTIGRQVHQARLLCNESFSATNEREGSEIATEIVRAMNEADVRVVFVTHLYEFWPLPRAAPREHAVPPRRARQRRESPVPHHRGRAAPDELQRRPLSANVRSRDHGGCAEQRRRAAAGSAPSEHANTRAPSAGAVDSALVSTVGPAADRPVLWHRGRSADLTSPEPSRAPSWTRGAQLCFLSSGSTRPRTAPDPLFEKALRPCLGAGACATPRGRVLEPVGTFQEQ